MQLHAKDLGKRFRNDWIFRKVSLTLQPGDTLAITGPNGSGKSTLLQVLAGILPPTEGTVSYLLGKMQLPEDRMFTQLSFCAPYQELIEEFTLEEAIRYHQGFKPLIGGMSATELMEKLYLSAQKSKSIKFFSSGMKQRLKLGLALFSDTPVLMLDEPTTNMDQTGVEWYKREVVPLLQKKLVLVCSNQPYEYEFCKTVFSMQG